MPAIVVASVPALVIFGGVGVWRSFAAVAVMPATGTVIAAVVVVKSVGVSVVAVVVVAAATARPSSS